MKAIKEYFVNFKRTIEWKLNNSENGPFVMLVI